MNRWARVLLEGVGLSAAVYAAASLTGGWLGTPPWWTTTSPSESFRTANVLWHFRDLRLREGRELVSAAVIVVGLALFAWAAWPRGGKSAKMAS